MAGTDASRQRADGGRGPAIVLVRPQLAENMGMAARAMKNCGLADLRVTAPREAPTAERGLAAASGADDLLHDARVTDSAAAAIADCHLVYATTARRRDLVKPVLTARLAADRLHAAAAAGQRAAVLFGAERTGLTNDEIALADAIVEVPLNPAFCSLNLAQAVLVIGYEWYQAGLTDAWAEEVPMGGAAPATHKELEALFAHLERELDACGFMRLEDKRPSMVRNLRAMFRRAGLTDQEVRTLHGIIHELVTHRRRRADAAGDALGALLASGRDDLPDDVVRLLGAAPTLPADETGAAQQQPAREPAPEPVA